MTRRIPQITAALALLGGIAAGGMALSQAAPADDAAGTPPTGPAAHRPGPMDGPHGGPMGPMMMGPMMGGGLDFAAIDTDHDGSLSRAELQARATAQIARADTNGDGALDRDEIVAALTGSRVRLFGVFAADPAEAMADRMIALLGGTEAGRVEVAVMADQRVNLLLAFADTDRDAAISQAEADAMKAQREHRMRHRHDRAGGLHGRGGDHGGPRGPRPDASPPPPATPAPAPEAPVE